MQERTIRHMPAIMKVTKQQVLVGVEKEIDNNETLAILLGGKKQGAELVSQSTHFFVCLFVYLERERENGRWGAVRQGERESQAGSVLPAWSLTQGLNPQAVRS